MPLATAPSPRIPGSLRWMILVLGLVLVVSTFWKKGRLGDNSRSRFITVERLVERNTWAHAAPGDTTPFPLSIDAIRLGDRIYSSKPPLYPLVMAGQAKALKAITGWDFYAHRKDYLRFLLLLNQVFPYLLMLIVAMRFLLAFTQNRWTLHFMLLALSLGCLAYGYTPEINNHSPAASLLLIAVWGVYRVWTGEERRRWMMALLGLLIGYTMALELPAMGFGVVLLGLLLWRDRIGGAMAGICMALPAIPTLWIFHEISGEWKPFYMQGKLYRWEGSYWNNPQDSDLLREPQALYFLKTLVGVKGLLTVTPLLTLPLGLLLPAVRRRLPDLPTVLKWAALPALLIIAYIGLRTYNYGGDCIGMRWYIVFMPLLLFMAWPVVEWLGQRTWGRVVSVALLAASMFQNVVALYMDCFIDIEKVF